MATTYAYRINGDTYAVDAIVEKKQAGDLPDGMSWLFSTEVAEGETPRVGMIWNGNKPATFREAPPESAPGGDISNLTPAELLDRQSQNAAEMERLQADNSAITDELQRDLGGN